MRNHLVFPFPFHFPLLFPFPLISLSYFLLFPFPSHFPLLFPFHSHFPIKLIKTAVFPPQLKNRNALLMILQVENDKYVKYY